MKHAHSLEVLFEDQWIIIINKPSGMLSVGYPGSSAKTAQDILFEMYKSRGKIKIAVIHRLDRDTSGVMMFARTADAKERFMNDWHEIVTERTYRCVCGRLPEFAPLPDSGIIDAPLAYNKYDVAYVPKKGDARALKDAESAVTRFKVLQRGRFYDLVECELDTGRKNQIRAHMAHLGHPVAGDEVYGKELLESGSVPERAGRGSRDPDSGNPTGRMALHARVIAFIHPYTHTPHRFEVNEPENFHTVIAVKPVQAPGAPGSEQSVRGKKDASAKGGFSARPSARDGKPAYRAKDDAGERPSPRDGAATGPRREKKESLDNLTDLKSVRRTSRTRQDTGKSRFIPGKPGQPGKPGKSGK